MLYPLLNLEAHVPAPPQPAPWPRRKHRMWVRHGSNRVDDRGAYTTIMAELYETDKPGFRNLIRMTPKFFEMLKERPAPKAHQAEDQLEGALECGPPDCHRPAIPGHREDLHPHHPEAWKELEKEFRLRWNVPHAIGALDGKM